MARSKIWKYYDKVDYNTAQCQLCEKIIKTSGNTSNLMKHMKTHPQIDVNDSDSIIVRGIYKREASEIGTRKRNRKLPSGRIYSIKTHTNGVKVEVTKNIKHDNSELENDIIDEANAAAESVAVHPWGAAESESAAETVSADDIIEFEPNVADQHVESTTLYQLQDLPLTDGEEVVANYNVGTQQLLNYHDKLAYFVCCDKLPLTVIQGEGFKKLTYALCPVYRLPTADELSLRINQLMQTHIVRLREQFTSLPLIALSCAITTCATTKVEVENQSYLEIIAHYHEEQTQRARTLTVQSLPTQFNGSIIVECLERTCQRFNIDKSKISCVVTKNSRMLENAVTAFLGPQQHLPCLVDILASVFEAVVQRNEFCVLCDKVRHYVESYHASGISGIQQKLKIDEKQRPITTYEMLESYIKSAPQLNKLLHSNLEGPPTLTSNELEVCQQMLSVLKPLASAVHDLCQPGLSSYPCASKALPIVYTIINELKQSRSSEHKLTYELRVFLVRQLEEHFVEMEKNVFLAMSSLLDPRFRNMPFQSSTLVAKYMTDLYDMLQGHEESGEAATAGNATDTEEKYEFWSAYRAFSHAKHKHMSTDSDDEIALYFCNSISSLQVDPMLLWKDMSQFHPFLFSLAKKYLHIPATALPPARLFTSAGALLVEQHNKLMGENMNNMLFMADCTEEEWNL